MISYSYPIEYNGEFNMARKNIEHKAILIINSDSIKSIYSEKWRRQKQKKFRYEYKKDSLFIKQGGQKLKYEFQVSQDTIRYIDREYKGFYMVLYSISKPKKKIEIEKLNKKLLNNSFQIDYSNLFIIPKKSIEPKNDNITFKRNNLIDSDKGGVKKWELIETDSNVFICLDEIIFQVYGLNKKGLILKSFFEKENTFKIKLRK